MNKDEIEKEALIHALDLELCNLRVWKPKICSGALYMPDSLLEAAENRGFDIQKYARKHGYPICKPYSELRKDPDITI